MDFGFPELTAETFVFLQQEENVCLLFETDTQIILEASPATARAFGWTIDQLRNLHMTDLLNVSDLPGWFQVLPSTSHPRTTGSLKHRRQNGAQLFCDASLQLVKWSGAKVILYRGKDITAATEALIRLAEREREARFSVPAAALDKAAAAQPPLQTIAGGVGHHVNNLLTIIDLHSGLLKSMPRSPAELDSLRAISEAVVRANEITRQLLGYASQGAVQSQKCDLNEVTRAALAELKAQPGWNIQLETTFTEELPPVQADPRFLQQCIRSALQNAVDFAGSAAPIRVRTIPATSRNDQVLLEIHDSGKGIPPEVLSRIFEPFFTTKPPGSGIGLSLAAAQGLLRQMGGDITLESKLGEGCCARISLPRLAPRKKVRYT